MKTREDVKTRAREKVNSPEKMKEGELRKIGVMIREEARDIITSSRQVRVLLYLSGKRSAENRTLTNHDFALYTPSYG